MESSASCLPGFFMSFLLLQNTVLTQGRDIPQLVLKKFVLGQIHTCSEGILLTCLQYSYSPFTLVIPSPPEMSPSHNYALCFVL